MVIPILQMSLSISLSSTHNLSSSSWIGPNPTHLFLTSKFSRLSIAKPPKPTPIRMGGGPRTFPGGVSKWQWKRMQAKKAKQLLRARLARERQVYEMRKRAELSAAVSELERPWEVVEKPPKLFSVSADEQLKVLADRFQKPGGFDMWSEKDGPQLFEAVDDIPSARFFPKGVVHSIKPYGKITDGYSGPDPEMGIVQCNGRAEESRHRRNGYQSSDEDWGAGRRNWQENSRSVNGKMGADPGLVQRNGRDGYSRNMRNGHRLSDEDSGPGPGRRNGHEDSRKVNGKLGRKGNRRMGTRDMDLGPCQDGLDSRNERSGVSKRGNGRKTNSLSNSRVFDMNLQDDGSYGILINQKQMK